MFKFAGEQAVEGAKSKIDSWLKSLTPQSVEAYIGQLPILAQIKGFSGDIKAGYDSMSPEQKATFWKDIMIAGAALAAKAA
jgi:hypothetical protein